MDTYINYIIAACTIAAAIVFAWGAYTGQIFESPAAGVATVTLNTLSSSY